MPEVSIGLVLSFRTFGKDMLPPQRQYGELALEIEGYQRLSGRVMLPNWQNYPSSDMSNCQLMVQNAAILWFKSHIGRKATVPASGMILWEQCPTCVESNDFRRTPW